MQLLTRQVGRRAVSLEEVAQVRLVRDDDSDGLLRVGGGVHAEVGDKVTALVGRLEALEGDVLSSLELDEVLDAVDDGERAVLVPLANIARAQPAVLGEYRLVFVEVIALVVALGDRGTTDEDLALDIRRKRRVNSINRTNPT